jgi:hypothetical protein
MNQLALFEAVETLHVVDMENIEEVGPVDPEPVETEEAEPVQFADWIPYDRELQQYYRQLPDVTDPDAEIRLTWSCPTRRGKNGYMNCSSGVDTVKLSDLNPDIMYCRHSGGAWEQKDPLPCRYCAQKVAELFTNLLK